MILMPYSNNQGFGHCSNAVVRRLPIQESPWQKLGFVKQGSMAAQSARLARLWTKIHSIQIPKRNERME